MRIPPFALFLLIGCGPVRLGGEEIAENPAQGFDAAGAFDGGASDLRAVVTLDVQDEGCASCVELIATAAAGTPPYTFRWDDGSRDARRTICAPVAQDAFTVTVEDARGARSAPQTVRLDLPSARCADASLPPTPQLCVQNPSFEGTAQVNATRMFDVKPWNDCTQPARNNTPDVVSDSIDTFGYVDVPKPTDGETFLGLMETEQASEPLCESLRGGQVRSFRIDARKLDLSNVTWDKSEGAFLSVYGGTSADCNARELLYVSPALTTAWQTLCVTIAPLQFMDMLTLQAISDMTQPQYIYVVVDHIVPVADCP
jgi:hypothetical protein